MKQLIKLRINGRTEEIVVEPYWTLLRVLRDSLGLMGTKWGCESGDCGVCSVIIDGKIINSCLVLAMDATDKEITTIEGLARDGNLHPLQQAFVRHGAIQCGYCTPGLIMAAKALLDEYPQPTEDDIKMALAGNLCRCTGYVKIVEAILSLTASGTSGT